MNKKAFITVEVLISMIILFSAIVMLSASIKAVSQFQWKRASYEQVYINVNSLINYLKHYQFDLTNITKQYSSIRLPFEELNGYKIDIYVKKVDEAYKKEIDEFNNVYKTNHKVLLLDLKLVLTKDRETKKYNIFLTKEIL